DPANQEYRIYVGYNVGGTIVRGKIEGGTNYVGLAPGASITFAIPSAIWDGARIYYVTDTPSNEKDFFSSGNPFNYDPNAYPYTQSAPLKGWGSTSATGMLLFYRGVNPNPDKPPPPTINAIAGAAQVAEFTIRDPSDTPDLPPSVDVDVQYIDASYLPAAMEV